MRQTQYVCFGCPISAWICGDLCARRLSSTTPELIPSNSFREGIRADDFLEFDVFRAEPISLYAVLSAGRRFHVD
jgi:hypothetical protein